MDVLLALLHIPCILWLLRVIAAGVGQADGNAGLLLTRLNIGLTIVASVLLVILDRYYASTQSEVATWRLIPVFISGCVLVGARVFWTVSEHQTIPAILKYLPKLMGIVNVLICVMIVFGQR
jgi:hypothetical protein